MAIVKKGTKAYQVLRTVGDMLIATQIPGAAALVRALRKGTAIAVGEAIRRRTSHFTRHISPTQRRFGQGAKEAARKGLRPGTSAFGRFMRDYMRR